MAEAARGWWLLAAPRHAAARLSMRRRRALTWPQVGNAAAPPFSITVSDNQASKPVVQNTCPTMQRCYSCCGEVAGRPSRIKPGLEADLQTKGHIGKPASCKVVQRWSWLQSVVLQQAASATRSLQSIKLASSVVLWCPRRRPPAARSFNTFPAGAARACSSPRLGLLMGHEVEVLSMRESQLGTQRKPISSPRAWLLLALLLLSQML